MLWHLKLLKANGNNTQKWKLFDYLDQMKDNLQNVKNKLRI
jgi:hypothetical protein